MAGPDHEMFVVAIVAGKLRQLTFKETIKISFLKKKISKHSFKQKTYKENITNYRKASAD